MDEVTDELGSTPISADAPAGVSVRYEPEFEKLQDEIAKLESADAKPVNWAEVVEFGSQILHKQSKDLLVACYVCVGLFEREGYKGLAAGLKVVSGLTANFWESLYPEMKRQRARVAAFEWVVDRLGPLLPGRKPRLSERDAVVSSKALLDELDQSLREKLGDQAPAWGELIRPLRDYEAEFEREETRKEQQALEDEKKRAEPGIELDSSGAVGSEQDVNKSLRSCQNVLRKVASYLREQDISNPSAYHLLRTACWLDVELPPAQDNTTQIAPLPADRLEYFKQQLQSGNHTLLINEVENSFANSPFWLDAHRLTATALEALGHGEAYSVVIGDVAAFLGRFPRLQYYQFNGGQPFADDLTRLWIDSDVRSGNQQSASSPGGSKAGESGQEPWLEASREAQKLAAKGKFKEAVALFPVGRRQANSRREQFLWDLHQARFCHEAGHIDVAMPQLESLDEESDRYHLEEWEPELSLQIAALLLVCYTRKAKKTQLSAERSARLERLRSRVSRLDAAAALELITNS